MAVLGLFPVDFVIFWGFGGGEVRTGFGLFRGNVWGRFPLWMSAGSFYYLCAWISRDILGCLEWQGIVAFSRCGSCLICVIVVLFPLVVSFSINWF